MRWGNVARFLLQRFVSEDTKNHDRLKNTESSKLTGSADRPDNAEPSALAGFLVRPAATFLVFEKVTFGSKQQYKAKAE